MPEIQEIEVNYNRKVQLNDFEPVQYGVTINATLGPDEDYDEAHDELVEQAEESVERSLTERLARAKMASDSDESDDD